jgi:NAD(P)-dependent dehydrogenase (short-subunit alcohol dehydrogenase family)
MQIKDSVFIVTGGASGLGAGAVRLLAAQGGKVVIADLNQAAGEALAAELGAQGAAARFVATNVADEVSAQACLAATLEAFGAVHGLVGCAGIVMGEKTVGKEGAHALASFKRVIDINLVGAFNMIRLAAEGMGRNAPNAEGERGVIVSTA